MWTSNLPNHVGLYGGFNALQHQKEERQQNVTFLSANNGTPSTTPMALTSPRFQQGGREICILGPAAHDKITAAVLSDLLNFA